MCQISQIAGECELWRAGCQNIGSLDPSSISLPSNSQSFPSYSEPVPEMEDFFGDGKRSVWNGWEVKFYVNSCVKMSSSHVRRVTCGIFPCEPNLDWGVTIWKVKISIFGICLEIIGLERCFQNCFKAVYICFILLLFGILLVRKHRIEWKNERLEKESIFAFAILFTGMSMYAD